MFRLKWVVQRSNRDTKLSTCSPATSNGPSSNLSMIIPHRYPIDGWYLQMVPTDTAKSGRQPFNVTRFKWPSNGSNLIWNLPGDRQIIVDWVTGHSFESLLLNTKWYPEWYPGNRNSVNKCHYQYLVMISAKCLQHTIYSVLLSQ